MPSTHALERLRTSGFFAPWRDPVSGIESWILTRKLAPVQQSFYFTHDCLSPDGRWLYTTCAFPPASSGADGRCLAIYDLEARQCRLLPETAFSHQNTLMDPVTDSLLWMSGATVYRRRHGLDSRPEPVATVGRDFLRERHFERLATHMTFNADRTALCLDARCVNRSILGALPLDGRPAERWFEQEGVNANHGQFHPADPDLLMFAQDHWHDAITGAWHPIATRIWLVRRPGTPRRYDFEPTPGTPFPLVRDTPADVRCHEWWSAGGDSVWVVDYKSGTQRIALADRSVTRVWPGGTCHSHASADGRRLVGDRHVYDWDRTPCSVALYDTATDRETALVTALPLPPGGMALRRQYHTDPHPRFCAGDRLIVYTTTAAGDVTVAFADAAPEHI